MKTTYKFMCLSFIGLSDINEFRSYWNRYDLDNNRQLRFIRNGFLETTKEWWSEDQAHLLYNIVARGYTDKKVPVLMKAGLK